jgi:DNA helicase-2/ATP-dependent DNA helicase PcrA
MSSQRKQLEIEDERTAEKQYAKVLRDRASQPSGYQGPANSFWTGSGVPKKRAPIAGELVGRVALVRSDDVLDGGSDFYIGETYAEVNGINVFGWTTPIACTFFRGSDHHYLCGEVAVVRAFRRSDGRIVDLVDEILRSDAPREPFKKQGLSIPAPPTRPRPPVPTIKDAQPDLSGDASEVLDEPMLDGPNPTAPERTPASPSKTALPDLDLPQLRAEPLLREQMLAPRNKGLGPVLSTLQPDQYEMVTIPAMDCVVIEGKPGTGKTIVASHRAAYLVNEETPPENGLDGDVLVVGPTTGYSRHIRDVINRLTGENDRIKVLSLPELISKILGVKQMPQVGSSRVWQDVGWELAPYARLAIMKLTETHGNAALEADQVYSLLRENPSSVVKDRDWSRYLRQLPPYREALTDGVHAPLVAFIQWELAGSPELDSVEHVIVDEAQDVTPLEWLLLDEINKADAWTILGDLNQRRSDHTLSDWAQVLEVIAIDPETPIRPMKRAYRSTKPILEFANRLLPRDQRKLHAFQESGPEPEVTKARPAELTDTVIREIERLISAYPRGTVAVISVSAEQITRGLRSKGWASSTHDPHQWETGEKQVVVANPDEARGLEFDGVVVVEPADFPKNFGRNGPLYTALTRANRELAVVYSRSLPDGLRRR